MLFDRRLEVIQNKNPFDSNAYHAIVLNAMKRTQLTNQIALLSVALFLLVLFFVLTGRLPHFREIPDYYERAGVYRKITQLWILCIVPGVIALGIVFSQVSWFKSILDYLGKLVFKSTIQRFLAVVMTIGLIQTSVTAMYMIGATPRILDEFNYYFQAQNFAAFQLFAPNPPYQDLFRFPFIISHDGRWFGSVYPGFSLFLAIGVICGVPWIINPIFAAGGFLCIFLLGRCMFDEKTGRVAVLLALFSPFYRMMGSIFMAHMSAMVFGSTSLLFIWKWLTTERMATSMYPFLGGCSLGILYWIRPQSAGVLFLPVIPLCILYFYKKRFRFYHIIAFFAPLVMAHALLGFYNYSLTGSSDLNPRYFVDPGRRLGFGDDIGEPLPGGGRSGHTWKKGITNLATLMNLWNSDLNGWGALSFIGIPLLLLLLGLIPKQSKLIPQWILFGSIVINFGLYFFYYTPSPNFGPRYLCETIPASLLLISVGILWINTRWSQNWVIPSIGVLLITASSMIFLPFHTQHYGVLPPKLERTWIPRMDSDSIYLIERDDYCLNVFTWNNPDLSGDIFIVDPGDIKELKTSFPDRAIYRVLMNRQDKSSRLQEVISADRK